MGGLAGLSRFSLVRWTRGEADLPKELSVDSRFLDERSGKYHNDPVGKSDPDVRRLGLDLIREPGN